MECLYVPQLEAGQVFCSVEAPEELRHVRALRLRQGERIALTNGCGVLVEAVFEGYDRRQQRAHFRIIAPLPGTEPSVPIGLVLSLLHERERLEFAVEKAVELGVRDIVLVVTRYTQLRSVRLERLQAKVVAAVKQAHRAWLPRLRGPMELHECCRIVFPEYPQRIVADVSGDLATPLSLAPVLVAVGPEGGWSPEELELLQQHGAVIWTLGPQRLRSETAAVVALGTVRYFLALCGSTRRSCV
jgi:16S rRNA (uracil1498-N3)-methyltransferase